MNDLISSRSAERAVINAPTSPVLVSIIDRAIVDSNFTASIASLIFGGLPRGLSDGY
jgi:hypothetical protein